MWKLKQKAPCEASGEAPPQLRLSREDKGELPIQFGSIAEVIGCEAKLVYLPLPNLGAMTPCANLVLTSELTDCVANTALVPQGTNKLFSRKAGTKALSSTSHLHYEAENK